MRWIGIGLLAFCVLAHADDAWDDIDNDIRGNTQDDAGVRRQYDPQRDENTPDDVWDNINRDIRWNTYDDADQMKGDKDEPNRGHTDGREDDYNR